MWRVKFSTPRKIGVRFVHLNRGIKQLQSVLRLLRGREPATAQPNREQERTRSRSHEHEGLVPGRAGRFLGEDAGSFPVSPRRSLPPLLSQPQDPLQRRSVLRGLGSARGCSGARRCLRATDQDLVGRPSVGSSFKQTMVRSPAASEVSRARRLARSDSDKPSRGTAGKNPSRPRRRSRTESARGGKSARSHR